MIKNDLSLFLILIGVAFSNCADSYISKDDLKAYPLSVKNGLIKSIDKSGIQIDVYYRPKDLIIAQELTLPVNETKINTIETQYDSLDYFMLRLSKNGKEMESSFAGNPERLSEVVSYLSSSIADRVYMVLEQDTISTLDAIYDRTFGATTTTQIMLIFKSNLKDQNGEVKLFYDDNFFGTGLCEFHFDIKRIKRIPRLNFHTL